MEANKRKPIFEYKKNLISATKKYEIIRVGQENQYLFKRIQERGSFYNVSKWEKDFEKNQYYKSNRCIYPSINFVKTYSTGFGKSKTNNVANYTHTAYTKKPAYDRFNFTSPVGRKNSGNEDVQENQVEEEEDDKVKELYTTNTYLEGLGMCTVKFTVQKQK